MFLVGGYKVTVTPPCIPPCGRVRARGLAGDGLVPGKLDQFSVTSAKCALRLTKLADGGRP